jgi:hypothetical protein
MRSSTAERELIRPLFRRFLVRGRWGWVSQNLHEFADYGEFTFFGMMQNYRLIRRVKWTELNTGVSEIAVVVEDFIALVTFDRKASARFRVNRIPQHSEYNPALPGASKRFTPTK